MKEKGSVIVLFVLTLTILTTGIVGSAYYLRSLQPKSVTLENNSKQTEVSVTPQPTPLLTSTPTPETTNDKLQDCFDKTGSINCPEGYVCDYSQSGGMTPQGYQTGPASGDGKCHKTCQTDSDCPQSYPKCISKELTGGDIVTSNQMCSKE